MVLQVVVLVLVELGVHFEIRLVVQSGVVILSEFLVDWSHVGSMVAVLILG